MVRTVWKAEEKDDGYDYPKDKDRQGGSSSTRTQGTPWPIELVYWLVTGVVTNE